MNCNNNGKTFVVSLTTVPGGTAANADYLLALDHYTCGNRKLCTQELLPVTANLQATPLGSPVDVGNGVFCQEVLVSGTCTYMPYRCGCSCCPQTDNIYTTICVPCSSNVTPKVGIETAVASPTNVQPCCNVTNCVAITTTLNVTTGA
jgi:hypothetical protein